MRKRVDLNENVAVVTGADSIIGREPSRASYAAAGAKPAAPDVDPVGLPGAGGRVRPVHT